MEEEDGKKKSCVGLFTRSVVVFAAVKLLIYLIWQLATSKPFQDCFSPYNANVAECSNGKFFYPTGDIVGCIGCGALHPGVLSSSRLSWEASNPQFFMELYNCSNGCTAGDASCWPAAPGDTCLCRAWLDSTCSCNLWLTYTLPFLALAFVTFLLQCFFYYHYDDFDPQAVVFELFFELSNGNWKCFREHFWTVMCDFRLCIFSMLEIASVAFIWIVAGENGSGVEYPQCCDGNDCPAATQALIFAGFATWFELYKMNLYFASQAWFTQRDPLAALYYAFLCPHYLVFVSIMLVIQAPVGVLSLVAIYPVYRSFHTPLPSSAAVRKAVELVPTAEMAKEKAKVAEVEL